MLYYLDPVIERKIEKTVGWREKTNFCPPPFVCCLSGWLWLLCWCCSHHCGGAHCVKWGSRRGGIERGEVFWCCKPKRCYLLWSITLCVCFANPTPLFSLFLAIFRQCCKRRTLATLPTTAQNFIGGHIFWVPFTCGHRCIALVTSLHTGGTIAQMLGWR